MPITMSAEYDQAYLRMLADVAECKKVGHRELTSFWPMIGREYVPGEGLFLVGRSVNGWSVRLTTNHLLQDTQRREVASQTRLDSEVPKRNCPMDWVYKSPASRDHKYNANRSAFWRVGRAALRHILGEDLDQARWSSWLAWSNLSKVSHWSGWNPSAALWRAQQRGCAELLAMELGELRPAHMLVLT